MHLIGKPNVVANYQVRFSTNLPYVHGNGKGAYYSTVSKYKCLLIIKKASPHIYTETTAHLTPKMRSLARNLKDGSMCI